MTNSVLGENKIGGCYEMAWKYERNLRGTGVLAGLVSV